MKRYFLTLFIVLLWTPAFATIPNTAIWEVESGGSDTNGGGFISGSGGTDYSQQTAAQVSVTDAVTNGTTTIVSATAGFTSAMVGNIIYVSGGTGSITPAWYQVVSRTNSTTIVVDRSTGLSVGTGATMKLGGAFATIQVGLNQLTSDQTLYVKAATYTITTTLTTPAVAGSYYNTQIIGYSTSRGDNGRPTISQTAAANILTPNSSQAGVSWSNFIMDGTNTALVCLSDASMYGTYTNITFKNCTTGGVNFSYSHEMALVNSEVTGITGGSEAVQAQGGNAIYYSYIHDNSISGITVGNAGNSGTIGNIIANNTGNGCDCNYNAVLIGNLFYGNSGDGARFSGGTPISLTSQMMNNIFAKNGGYGVNNVLAVGGSNVAPAQFLNNGFWNNTTAAINGFNLPGSTNILITGSGTTNDPFVSDSTHNWSLNNTAGAGALFRNAGFAGVYTGLGSVTGYQDIGPYRHQDPSSGGASGGAFPFGG